MQAKSQLALVVPTGESEQYRLGAGLTQITASANT